MEIKIRHAEERARKTAAIGEYIQLITQGKYSVWIKTPVGEGAGVVEFGPNGKLSGVIRRSPTSEIGSKLASGSSPPYLPSELRPGRLACLEWMKSI
jgi:hypothetical protein